MQTVASLMARARNDPYLQAFQLRRLCRSSPLSVLANAEEFTKVLAELDGPLAADILEELGNAVEQMAADTSAATPHPGFARFLIKLLAADGRWFIQVRCVKLLVSSATEQRVVQALMALLAGTHNPRVQACVLSALGGVKADIPLRAVKPFLTHPDARIRAAALEALLSRDLGGMGEVFSLLLNDEAPRVKALAAVGLWRMGNPVLLEMIKDAEQLDHRLAYLHALGLTGKDSQTRKMLLAALKSEHASERRIGCKGLRSVAEADDIPELVESALEMTGRETREELIRTCGAIDRQRTVATLHSLLIARESSRQPRPIATLLAMVPPALGERPASQVPAGMRPTRTPPRGPECDVEYLARFLDSPDGRVRANAVDALSVYAALPKIQQSLVRCYGSEVPRVKANAAIPLWRAGYQVVLRGLKEMLTHGQSCVRASAAWALGRIGGIVARSYLERALDDSDDAIRKIAFAGLADV
jgi:HEAT repeat protein